MGKLYLDLEFTNGNYYLADILELALFRRKWIRFSYLKDTLLRTEKGEAVNRYYK